MRSLRVTIPADGLGMGEVDDDAGNASGCYDERVGLDREAIPSLKVRALAPHQLLAMKLCAWRDDVDIADARLLLTKLPSAKDEAWQLVEPHLQRGRELKARYAFDDLWEEAHGAS